MLESGVPLKLISEQLGHSGIGITSAIYVHVTDTMQQQAVETFAGFLARPVPKADSRGQPEGRGSGQARNSLNRITFCRRRRARPLSC